jgi:large subunit ribosomal protein L9
MELILKQDVQNLGFKDDVVNVKNGYGRNFLIPQRRARRATEAAIADFAVRRAELEKLAAEKLAAAEAVGIKLKDMVLEIGQKAGVDGRLFGSVTNHDIADALKAKGFTIEKSSVRLPTGPLKMVGDHPVAVAVHTDVVADITIRVVGEQA